MLVFFEPPLLQVRMRITPGQRDRNRPFSGYYLKMTEKHEHRKTVDFEGIIFEGVKKSPGSLNTHLKK